MFANKLLIKELQNHSSDAFDEVYLEFNKLVFYAINTIVNDIETTKDLVQDTFIKMWNNIHSFRLNTNFRAWLLTIAKNTARDYLRTRKVYYPLDDEVVKSTDDNLILNDFYMDARDILSELEYSIVVLIVIYNLKRREVSTFLERPISTITRIYGNAIKKLKGYYEV